MSTVKTINLARLSKLGEIFPWLNSGKHLNRLAEPVLWLELEQERQQYELLFQQLGYQLRIDERGFAWFHTDDANSNVSKATRQLALVLMVLFDFQADNNQHLGHFSDWLIDRALLALIYDKHTDLLKAELLDVDAMMQVYDSATRYGFALSHATGWRLLPAAARYLDHFEVLAQQQQQNDDELTEVLSDKEEDE